MITKNYFYILVVAVLVVIGMTLLLFYYTQDFEADFDFLDLEYSSITIKTSIMGESTYLESARAEIGELKLSNKGYFTQIYVIPEMVGCVNFKESGINSLQFSVNLDPPPRQADELKIKVGDESVFKIMGVYQQNYRNQLLLDDFSSDKIKNLEIYKIPTDEKNPFWKDYRSKSYYYDCSMIQSELEAFAVLQVN